MPDITMCKGREIRDGVLVVCPKFTECYRYTAKPTPGRQSFFSNLPLTPGGDCKYFAPNHLRK